MPLIQQGKVTTQEGVLLTWSLNSDGSYQLDRIEVPVALRKQGLCRQTMATIATEADTRGLTLSLNILPDDWEDEQGSGDHLRKLAMTLGFQPLELDGEIYRNDLTRTPRR